MNRPFRRMLAIAGAGVFLSALTLHGGPTVTIAPNVNQPGSNPDGITVANGLNLTPLAGKTTTDPDPTDIPPGSTIFGAQANGSVAFTPPGGAETSTVVPGGLTVNSFMIVAAGTTGLTLSTNLGPLADFSPFSANQQVGVTTPGTPAGPGGACSTNLLFPFVTNQLGFDTGIAIANTSTDPFGGTNGPAVDSTLSFAERVKLTFSNIPAGITLNVAPVSAGSPYQQLDSTLQSIDDQAAGEESPPVVGDLGGPVDENL